MSTDFPPWSTTLYVLLSGKVFCNNMFCHPFCCPLLLSMSTAGNSNHNIAQNALQWEWGNFPFANWNGICWGLPLQLVQLIKIHFLPHLESFMWERKFEKKFFKKSHIQTPNGVLLIFKLPFPNGSYRNGVCRALWAKMSPGPRREIEPSILCDRLISLYVWRMLILLWSTG